MKERPILFSTGMVKAILDGKKTMTRRVFKGETVGNFDCMCTIKKGLPKKQLNIWGAMFKQIYDGFPTHYFTPSPYGFIGDLLWVKETFAIHAGESFYRADECVFGKKANYTEVNGVLFAGWKPSIFMPKKFARIWLKVTEIRVERLQSISDSAAIQEGINRTNTSIQGYATTRFKGLWNSINEKRGFGWDTNPWVWVVGFERVQKS